MLAAAVVVSVGMFTQVLQLTTNLEVLVLYFSTFTLTWLRNCGTCAEMELKSKLYSRLRSSLHLSVLHVALRKDAGPRSRDSVPEHKNKITQSRLHLGQSKSTTE